MRWQNKALLGVHSFNGLSAFGGGVVLMSAWRVPGQGISLRHSGFADNYFPGVILMAIVGGSALLAVLAMVKRVDGWQLSSIVAGVIMIVWIVGEVASIRAFHFLQVIYLVTGALVLLWTPGAAEPGER